MSGYTSILLENDGPVTRLTFNRPERRNALTHTMMLELEDAFAMVRGDANCRVLVLRGAGENFCAGGDLDAMADMPPNPGEGLPDPLVGAYRQFGHALQALDTLPQATVAVVEGSAVGGGFGMACCSDVMILHEAAKLGMPEPKWGFIPSQILPYVVRRVGEGVARDLAVTGRILHATEAYHLRISTRLASTFALKGAIRETINDILQLEPAALAAAKRLVLSCQTKDDAAVLDDAAESLVGLLRQPAAAEGIKAFKAKQSPPWSVKG